MNSLFSYIDRDAYSEGKKVLRWKDYNVEIGEDGSTYNHQRLTHRLIKRFAKIDGLSEVETIKLRITALVHDLGEYEEGDKLYGTKTSEEEERERKAWIRVAKKVSKNNVEILKNMKIGFHIDTDKESPLFERFKIYERLGYINGAILAIHNNHYDHTGLHWLCHAVIVNQYTILDSAATDYPSVEQFLEENQKMIQAIFSLGEKHKKSPEKDEAFQRAKKLFESGTNGVQ